MKLSLVFFSFFISSTYAYSAESFTLGSVEETSYDTILKVTQKRVEDVYRNIGINVKVKTYPGLRSLLEANIGNLDGEVSRIKGLESEYSNLIMLKPAIFTMEHLALTRNKNLVISKIADFKQYRTSTVLGIKWQEELSKKIGSSVFRSNQKAIELLCADRLDIVIGDRLPLEEILKSLPKEKREQLHFISIPIPNNFLYHYIHKRHKDLAPKIEQSIEKVMAKVNTL